MKSSEIPRALRFKTKQVSTVEALEVMDLTELQQVVYYEARNSGACHDDALDATVGI